MKYTNELQARREGGGCDGCARSPPRAAEVHVFGDERFQENDEKNCSATLYKQKIDIYFMFD